MSHGSGTRKYICLTALLPVVALCLSGCSSDAVVQRSDQEARQNISLQRMEHQRKQRQRYIEGNYQRLYRPSDRRTVERY